MSCGYYYKTAKKERGEAGVIVFDKSQEIEEELWLIPGLRHTPERNTYYVYDNIGYTVDELNKCGFSLVLKHDIYTADNEIGLYHKAKDAGNTNVSPSQLKFDQDTMIREITKRGDEAYAFYKKWLSESESLDERDRKLAQKVLDYFKKKRFVTLTKEETDKIVSDCRNHDHSFWDLYSSREEFNKYLESAKRNEMKPTVIGALNYFIKQYKKERRWIKVE